MIDLSPFLRGVEDIVRRHALGRPGSYARFTQPGWDETGAPRSQDENPYGCADAANLLYTLGRLPGEPGLRASWIESLQRLQDDETGWFRERTHHPIHTTAHCLGALDLFDARPRHALSALRPLQEPAALDSFLDDLDWKNAPWTEAHRGAGFYAALVLAEEARRDLDDRYFGWLAGEVDPATGLVRRGCVDPDPSGGVFPHLAGTFHYLFNAEHARRPWPHADALVDTCLAIRDAGDFPLARHVWFADVDWVYCLSRASRQTDHRFGEARHALVDFAGEYARFVLALDPASDTELDDLHRLFGTVCALAELQAAAPGQLWSEKPLRLVLDRRPFI